MGVEAKCADLLVQLKRYKEACEAYQHVIQECEHDSALRFTISGHLTSVGFCLIGMGVQLAKLVDSTIQDWIQLGKSLDALTLNHPQLLSASSHQLLFFNVCIIF